MTKVSKEQTMITKYRATWTRTKKRKELYKLHHVRERRTSLLSRLEDCLEFGIILLLPLFRTDLKALYCYRNVADLQNLTYTSQDQCTFTSKSLSVKKAQWDRAVQPVLKDLFHVSMLYHKCFLYRKTHSIHMFCKFVLYKRRPTVWRPYQHGMRERSQTKVMAIIDNPVHVLQTDL